LDKILLFEIGPIRRNSFALNRVKQAKQDKTHLLHYYFGIFLRNFNGFNPIISMGNKSISRKMVKKLIPLVNFEERNDAFADLLPFPEDLHSSSDRSVFSGGKRSGAHTIKIFPRLKG